MPVIVFPKYWLPVCSVLTAALAARAVYGFRRRRGPETAFEINLSKYWPLGYPVLLAWYADWAFFAEFGPNRWWSVPLWGFLVWRRAGYPPPLRVGLDAVIYVRHACRTAADRSIRFWTVRHDPLNISWTPITAPRDLRIYFVPGAPRTRDPQSFVVVCATFNRRPSERFRRTVAYFYRNQHLHTVDQLKELLQLVEGGGTAEATEETNIGFDIASTDNTGANRVYAVSIRIPADGSAPTWGRRSSETPGEGPPEDRIVLRYIGLDELPTVCPTLPIAPFTPEAPE